MRPVNYFYVVSGEDAEFLLARYGLAGEFLARPSYSQSGNYALSVSRGPGLGITHVPIQTIGDSFTLVGHEFAALTELIQYFIEHPKELREQDGKTIKLLRAVSIPWEEPLAKMARGPIAERWFHANLTGAQAKEILLKEKQWAYLVRESARQPGNYVISLKTGESVVKHIMITRESENEMFHVNGGDSFRTINDLLAHYNNNPMVEMDTQNVVHLRTAIPSSCFPADAIEIRLAALRSETHAPGGDGIDEEFKKIQSADDQLYSRKEGKKPANVKKNRYKNIVPYDHTRVVLKDVPEGESDYINANYIKINEDNPLLCSQREYISTQGCLENTVCDLLLMMWECDSRVIVMTTKEVERGRAKCHRYWPEHQQQYTWGDFTVICLEEVSQKDAYGEECFIIRKLQLIRNGLDEKRQIAHLQFVGWPDHGCPEHPEPVLNFLDAVETAVKTHGGGPPIVHCSAGIGRTGTFIVIDVLINHIKRCGRSCAIDIPRTVLLIREQRSGMVQTVDQYRFVYKAISTYIDRTTPHRRSVNSPKQPLAPPPLLPRKQKLPDQARSYVNASKIGNGA
ncbi:unnamed protein product, partial [Mesorhabditis spiculigera]